MKFWIKLAELFGILNKAKGWMQGKKTYATNIVQLIAGVVAILALAGQVLDLVAKTITLLMGWGDGAQATGDAMEAVKGLWANHAVLVAGFSAAFYSITDACSKMASYAASRRDEKKRSAAYGPLPQTTEVKQ